LSISDTRVIDTTIKRLPSSVVIPFMNAIVARLESTPSRAQALVPWIRATLVHHATYVTTGRDWCLGTWWFVAHYCSLV
jgi:Fe2+ transport system protein B